MPECCVPRTSCHNTPNSMKYNQVATEQYYVRNFEESAVMIPTLICHCGLTVDLQTVTMVMDETLSSVITSPFSS